MISKKITPQEAGAYEYIIALIHQRCGIKLHGGKEELIKSRLGKRMRHHGMEKLADYCQFLQTRADEDEFTLVVNALTTNFTNFLREGGHFQFMVQQALPSVLPKVPSIPRKGSGRSRRSGSKNTFKSVSANGLGTTGSSRPWNGC